MILNTRFSKYLPCILIFMGCSIVAIAYYSETQGEWFTLVFRDMLYLYQLTPVFLVGILLIDQHYGTSAMIRMDNRVKAVYESIFFKYMFAVIYLNTWFTLVIILSVILYDAPFFYSIQDVLNLYIHFLLGFLIIINLSDILKRSKLNVLKFSPVFAVYLLMMVELMAIEPIMPFFNISVFFGWIFKEGLVSYVALFGFFFASLFYLVEYSSKKDIL